MFRVCFPAAIQKSSHFKLKFYPSNFKILETNDNNNIKLMF